MKLSLTISFLVAVFWLNHLAFIVFIITFLVFIINTWLYVYVVFNQLQFCLYIAYTILMDAFIEGRSEISECSLVLPGPSTIPGTQGMLGEHWLRVGLGVRGA